MKSVKRLISFALVLAFLAALPACNTVRGMGRDVEEGGEAIQEVAE
jgi:predicted small secreted protein